MAVKRRSLRDVEHSYHDPAPETPAAPEPTPEPATRPAPRPRTAGSRRTPTIRTAATTRTGIYFRPETFDDAKSAYLVDLDARPEAPDSIARWIAEAMELHANKTPEERKEIVNQLPEEPQGGAGFTRSFELPDHVLELRDGAITTDRRNGRVTTRSGFATEAIRHAIEQARQRAGGVLPEPPARLPNKPIR